jgi:hypothetical protein
MKKTEIEKQYMREYRLKHKARLRHQRIRWMQDHREQDRRKHRLWYRKNRARINAERRAKRNPELVANRWQNYAATRRGIINARSRARKYGISMGAFNLMCLEQRGRCAICETLPVKKALDVDHDAATKQIRGLLCQVCNKALGAFKHDIVLLRAAIEYLTHAEMAAVEGRQS